MKYRIGQLMMDPTTGDKGRIVGFTHDNQPLCKTTADRLFVGGYDLRGPRRSFSKRYFDGYLKVCNCAGCREVLLGLCHEAELQEARNGGDDLTGVPELVAGRVGDRPYCESCLRRL